MFCVGVVITIVGGLLAATADTTATVISAQLVSGVDGALILPNSLAVLGATFTDPHRRTEVITAWAASSGIGVHAGLAVTAAVFLAAAVVALTAVHNRPHQNGAHVPAPSAS